MCWECTGHTTTWLWPGRPGNSVSIASARDVSLLHIIQTDSEAHPASYSTSTNLGKEKIASKISMVVTSIFQKKKKVITHLGWKDGYDINLESVSDNQAEDISVIYASDSSTETTIPHDINLESVSDNQAVDVSVIYASDNSTETTIPLQNDSIINQTVPLNQVKVPNRVSSRQKKPPNTKSDDFLW